MRIIFTGSRKFCSVFEFEFVLIVKAKNTRANTRLRFLIILTRGGKTIELQPPFFPPQGEAKPHGFTRFLEDNYEKQEKKQNINGAVIKHAGAYLIDDGLQQKQRNKHDEFH